MTLLAPLAPEWSSGAAFDRAFAEPARADSARADPTPARSPLLEVRGRPLLHVDPPEIREDTVRVRGALADRETGDALAAAPVSVSLGEVRAELETDGNGHFATELDREASELAPREGAGEAAGAREAPALAIEFPGTEHYEESEVELGAIHLGARPLALELELPDSIRIDRPGSHSAAPARESAGPQPDAPPPRIRARSADAPAEVGVELAAGPRAGDLRALAELELPGGLAGGAAELPLDPEELGPPGRVTVVARRSGDADYLPARAEADLRVVAETELSFGVADAPDARAEAEATLGEREGPAIARGELAHALGDPVAGALVEVRAPGGRVAAAKTDRDGRFSARLPPSDLGAGERELVALFEPERDALLGARSRPVVVEVDPESGIPLAYTFAALAGAGLVGLGFFGGRAVAGVRKRREERAAEASSAAPPAGSGAEAARPAPRPTGAARLRRAKDYGIEARARDAVSGTPIAGAAFRIAELGASAAHRAGKPRHGAADGTGRATFELPAGAYEIESAAPGYVRARFRAEIPHRGELRGVSVSLWPVRDWMFRRYREVAEALLPAGEPWGTRTPRQIVRRARASRPAAALAALTDAAEEAYFAARTPRETELEAFEELVRAAREEAGLGDRDR